MLKLNLVVVLISCLVSACASTSTEHEGEGERESTSATGQWLAGGRFAGSQPRKLQTAFTPRALSHKPIKVMLELEGDPITVVQAQKLERRLDIAEKQLIRSKLRSTQGVLEARVGSLGGHVLRSYQNSYNGLAVQVQRDRVAGLEKLPGVVAVHELRLMKRSTTKSVPFVAAPAVWNGVLGFRGEHVKVAILDTGIDYTHANFGGPGTVAAYESAHANETAPAAPALFGPKAPRIKGGTDLVGDAYDPSSDEPEVATPHPDPNPLDCQGHGSHVAGIAAGSGVTPAGATYRGPYDASTYSRSFRIGPGVAPKADLYAVRIFGCDGGTDAIVDGIEWAVDHDMDVINLSLGSEFGGADDPAAIAARNAVRAGVVVVAAAGNAGNLPYLESTPASGDGVISVAATDATPTTDAGLPNPGFRAVAWFSAGGPRFGDSELKPNVIAPGVNVVSTAVGTGSGAVVGSGTSMASPVVAGVAALVRQAHPTWSARSIATVISNTAAPAGVAGYSTRLAGAGAAQAPSAVKTGAFASSDRSPAVSFGFVELKAGAHLQGNISVFNQERTPMQFNVSIRAASTQGVPHVATVSKPKLRIFGGESANFNLDLTLPVPNVDPLTFNDFAGVVELTPADSGTNHGVTLRVPYYGVARPEANLDADLDPAPTARRPNGQLELHNPRSPIAGTAEVYAWGIEGEKDLKSCNDIRALGVQSQPGGEEGPWLVFALEAWRRCSNSSVNEYDILLKNELGQEFAVVGIDQGLLEAEAVNGVLVTAVIDLQTNDIYELPAFAATDSATVQLAAPASLLGLSAEAPRFSYSTQTFNLAGEGNDAPPGEARFNAYTSSLIGLGQYVAVDGNSRTKLPIGVNRAEFAATPNKGWLVLLADNAPGPKQTELLPLRFFRH